VGIDFLLRYGAVIFDLDGTLADSMQVWERILPLWAQRQGLRLPGDHARAVAAMTLPQAAEYVIGLTGGRYTQAQLLEQWSAQLADMYAGDVRPKSGAGALLQALHSHGMPMALATSSDRRACQGFLRTHHMERYFPVVVFSGDVGRDKSRPDIYLRCAGLLGVSPCDCVAVEDLPEAIRGARAAGMGTVAVYDESCADWRGLSAMADLAVRSLEELL